MSKRVNREPRVRGYGEGYSRRDTSRSGLRRAYRPVRKIEYRYSGRISQITRLKYAFSEKVVMISKFKLYSTI